MNCINIPNKNLDSTYIQLNQPIFIFVENIANPKERNYLSMKYHYDLTLEKRGGPGHWSIAIHIEQAIKTMSLVIPKDTSTQI